jgi:uncharacterized membrane protein YdjX (TVP38/TMEM64 family)
LTNQPAERESNFVSKRWGKRLVVLALLAAAFGLSFWLLGDYLKRETLASYEGQLRELVDRRPILCYSAAFLLYVLVTGLSIPGASALSLGYGWLFGLVGGVVLVSFASTTGATIAFLLSRYLFYDAIRVRFGERFERFDKAWKRDGPFFLFTLRLIPAVPFFVINAVMGLTPIPALTFWWVSQLGMLPGTIVYLYAGSSVPGLQTLADRGIGAAFSAGQLVNILIAFALLGLFPLMTRWILRYFGMATAIDEGKAAGSKRTRS